MLNLDKFYKKDNNFIEVIDYSKKGISKKAIYHDGNSSEKIYLIYKDFQPFEDAYFYNDISVVHLGKIENLHNWDSFKNVIPTNSYCVVNKNLDILVKDEDLDSKGFSLKPSIILNLVKNYGIGALQILKPEMLLIKGFEKMLGKNFDIYCKNIKNQTKRINLETEKIAFNKLIEELKEQLTENEHDL